MEKLWLIWFIFGAILLVGEIFTAGFFLMWFGIAAILAGFIDLLGLGLAWQWGIFVLSSGILIFYSKKIGDKITHDEPDKIGANRMLQKEGVVTKTINPNEAGMVKISGDEWLAISHTGEKITKGTLIKVLKVDGTRLVVMPIHKED